MADLLVALFVLIVGVMICFVGLRVFFVTLPILGFVTGFYVGAEMVVAIFGDGFLATGSSWVTGIGVGILFGALSYLFWFVGAIIASGATGALVGSGLMAALGVDSGWIVFLASATFAVLSVLIAMTLALPIFVVMINTALVGAAALTTGVMLALNQVDVEDFGYGSVSAMINESWFWVIVWGLLGIAGIYWQSRALASFVLPDDRWSRASAEPSPAH